MSSADRYQRVYGQDHPSDGAHGWIQWKGTSVCMDVHCECGHHGHIDAEFFYNYRCVKCGAVFAVGQVVKLIKLEGEDLEHVLQNEGLTIKDDPSSLEDDS